MKKMITIRPNTEWYIDEIHEEKPCRRQLERQWQKSGLEVHRQMYCKQRLHVNTLLDSAKQKYCSDMVRQKSKAP